MQEIVGILAGLTGASREEVTDPLEISLELQPPASQQDIQESFSEAGISITLRPAFLAGLREATGDRFWIAVFPRISVQGHEAAAFELSRRIAQLPHILSARPVLVDSLVGTALASRAAGFEESVFDGCESHNSSPKPHGWAPRGLGALTAWTRTRGSGVTVASIDTGSSSHKELQGIWSGKAQLNLVEGGGDASDRFSTDSPLSNPGHGTLVASVVGSRGAINPDGSTDGPSSVTGMAPEADILPIRAIRSVVYILQSQIPAAIEHAIAQECDVIIMALGSPFPIQPVEVALRAAVDAGLVVVCAAGNCVGIVVFPARFAAYDLTCAVAAVDHAYTPWEKTSRGDAVTISAFGEGVWGARKNRFDGPDDVVAPAQGTTLASSLTAGAAALWVAAHGGRQKLKQHADALGVTVQKLFNDAVIATAHRPSAWPDGMGAGVVNAGALVARPLPAAEETLPITPLPLDHVTPLQRFLAPVAGEFDSLAGLEAATLPEDMAAEALWRMAVSSSTVRAVAIGALEGLETPQGHGTPGFEAALGVRPRLRTLTR